MSDDSVLPPDDDPLGIEGSEELGGPDPVEASAEPGAPSAADPDADVAAPIAEAVTGDLPPAESPGRSVAPPARPDLAGSREPLYRECRGYRLRLDPPDLARLRELPGSRGKSDSEIGEAFFDGQAERLAASIADDVPSPSEIRVVVDPYSRQAFLALENQIRGILSF
jgi:hypothetical protein